MLGFDKTEDISCHTPGDEGRIARHLFPHSHRLARLHMFHVPDTVPLLFKLWPMGEARWLRRDCTGRCELVTPDGAKGDHGRLENTSRMAVELVGSSCIVACQLHIEARAVVQTTRIVAGRQTLGVTKGRDVTSPKRFGIFANLCNCRSRGTARSLNTAEMQALVSAGAATHAAHTWRASLQTKLVRTPANTHRNQVCDQLSNHGS